LLTIRGYFIDCHWPIASPWQAGLLGGVLLQLSPKSVMVLIEHKQKEIKLQDQFTLGEF
jgi:hypothetical protein